MNTYVLLSVVLLAAPSALSQGTFENLDFELANPGPLTPASPPYSPFALNVPVANALPDWTVDYGTVQQSVINVNDPTLGATGVTLITSAYITGFPLGSAIDGTYSVLLQGGGEPIVLGSISQTGLIPTGTQSLLFEAEGGYNGPLDVFIGNQSVSFGAVGTGANYTLYGASNFSMGGSNRAVNFFRSRFRSA